MKLKKEANQLIDRILGLVDSEKIKNDGISRGRTSSALFWAYYGKAYDNEYYKKKSLQCIEEVIENFSSGASTLDGFGFYNGLLGFLSVLSHLSSEKLLEVDMDIFGVWEKMVFEWSLEELKAKNIDYFSGFNGVFEYFVNRLIHNDGSNSTILNQRVNALMDALETNFALHSSKGEKFLFNNYYNAVEGQSINEVNYGIAHGMGATLLTLLSLRTIERYQNRCDNLLQPAIETLQLITKTFKPKFPHGFVNGYNSEEKIPTCQLRLGWCYSDLNQAHVLHLASNIYSNVIDDEILTVATDRICRPIKEENNQIYDPFLCHGFAGVAHYLKILSKTSGDIRYQDAADLYIEKTIEFYETHDDNYFTSEEFLAIHDPLSLFYGHLGVGLCLLSHTKPEFSNWSKIILL